MIRVLLSLETYPDDTQLASSTTGGGSELPVPSVLLPRRGLVATAACQALASMLTLASPSSSSSSATGTPTLASLVGWIPQGCVSVVDVLKICIGDVYATTAALNALVRHHHHHHHNNNNNNNNNNNALTTPYSNNPTLTKYLVSISTLLPFVTIS